MDDGAARSDASASATRSPLARTLVFIDRPTRISVVLEWRLVYSTRSNSRWNAACGCQREPRAITHLAHRPRHPVWPVASRDATGLFQRLQVDDGDVVGAIDRDVRARSVRRDENALGPLSHFQALDLPSRRDIDDDQLAGVEVGDEHAPAIRRELQPVRPFRLKL